MPDSSLRTVATGIGFGESLRWHAGRLWVADWATHELLRIQPDGTKEVVLQTSFTFSFDWAPDGRLLLTSAGEHPLLQQGFDGNILPVADLRGLNIVGANEIVVDSRGNVYMNCVGFNLMAGEAAKPGSIICVSVDGSARRVAEGLMFPNGMAITPDNRTLIVAESYSNQLTAYAIAENGDLTNRRVWAPVEEYHPDGICLGSEGNVWFADVASKHCIRVREGGEILQTVKADRGCFACMLGGKDGTTLFIVTNEWAGANAVSEAARNSQIVSIQVQSAHSGRP